ncbi:MAG: hypothetical protein NWF01_08590 [Candidatus Bathyarchaeota archaeon]|nr:hypothetical protein [Candidatus Bathyarchaeota archaeon]
MDKSDLLHAGNITVFVFALVINGFVTIPFLNNRTIVEVSDLYANLLTPAGYVFSIWGIIYSLLLVFIIYQAIPRNKNAAFQKQIGGLFILTNLLNIAWLIAWQYDYIALSVGVMIALVAVLATIYLRLQIGKSHAPILEKLCVHVTFSAYLGWITIATVANIAAAAVYFNLSGFGLSSSVWALIGLVMILISTIVVIARHRDFVFSLVVIWAIAGIGVKQFVYPDVVTGIVVSIIVILLAWAVMLTVLWLRRKKT